MLIQIRVAKNLRLYRLAAGLTQQQLAKAMTEAGETAWAQPQVSDIEHGRVQVRLSTLERLAELLKVGVIDLIAMPPANQKQAIEVAKHTRGKRQPKAKD